MNESSINGRPFCRHGTPWIQPCEQCADDARQKVSADKAATEASAKALAEHRGMTSGELIELLKRLDPTGQLEVIRTRCSDYGEMDEDEVSIVEGIKKSSACYIMRTHATLPPEEVVKIRRFIHFAGN